MAADEVLIYREDHRLIIEPINQSPSLKEVLSSLQPLDDDFPTIDGRPTTPETLL